MVVADEVTADDEGAGEVEGVEEARTKLLGAPLQVPNPDLHLVPQ